MNAISVTIILTAIFLFSANPVQYTIVNLGTPLGESAFAFSINNLGQIVGRAEEGFGVQSRCFLLENLVVKDLGTLGGSKCTAASINDRGQIVGYDEIVSGIERFNHAFLWEKGVMTDLGTLPGHSVSTAWDINERGQIVGQSARLEPREVDVFLWENGVMTNLGDIGEGPVHINERGQVVGHRMLSDGLCCRAFLWEKGVITDLGDLGGPTEFTIADAINDRGQIVGISETASGENHVFLWEKGMMNDLGFQGRGFDINNRGQIVGNLLRTASGEVHAFVWEKGALVDLGTLGGLRSFAVSINERGEIVGGSTFGESRILFHAVLWTRAAHQQTSAPPSPTSS